MKELFRSSPDGSRYYGNGVWDPSTLDLQRSNLSFNEKSKTKEEPNNNLLLISQESVVGRLLQTISKVKLPAKFAIPGSIATVLLISACGGENKNTQELENKASSGYSLPFPEGETWFLTTGPHGDGFSAIDIAPPEFGRLNGNCPTDGSRLSIDNRVVTASASGEVVLAGKDNDRNDPFHSIVDIKDNNGLTQRYIHLDNIRVKSGNKIKQGEALGNPSCEYPPGGGNTGPHLHVGLMKDGQTIPIDGVEIGGWTIHENGTMTKQGEKTRTANVGRYTGENSIGIRNDLPNTSNKLAIASPKDAIPPISGQVNEKKVEGKAATATPKSSETKKEEWKTFKSPNFPYEIKYPASWKDLGNPENFDALLAGEDTPQNLSGGLQVFYEPADSDVTLESFLQKQEQNINEWNDEWQKIAILKTTKRKVAGFNAQTILSTQTLKTESPPTTETFEDYATSFIVLEIDDSRRMWTIRYRYNMAEMSSSEAERLNNRFLESFSVTRPSKNIPIEKKAAEKKVSLSKKPDELYRALLTNSISSDILPQGMSSRGTSAGEIDATGKALKQIGAVTIKIEDSVSTSAKGVPNGGISYTIFPDSSTAKNASEIIGTHLENGQVLKDFPYPAKVYTLNTFGLVTVVTKIVLMSVENVTVVASFTGTNPDLLESRAISLTHAAIEHLGKVGK